MNGVSEVEFKLGLAVGMEIGGSTPLSAVEKVVAVLIWIEKLLVPPTDVRSTLGVGTALCDDDAETLEGAGGKMPLSPVDRVIAVLEEVEISTVPSPIDISISRLGVGVADVVLELLETSSGRIPEPPVVEADTVLPENVTLIVPPVGEGVTEVSLPESGTLLLLSGGRIPESPVE